MSGRCVVEAISGGKISPASRSKRKTQSFRLARGGEIDCFRSFRDEPDERSSCSAIFFLDAGPKIW